MPYTSIGGLPPAVKNALPNSAQHIFMAAFNSAFKRKLSEERCFKIAWAAVKNAGYHPNPDGKWSKDEKDMEIEKDAPQVVDNGNVVTFNNVVLSKEGVMNGVYKSKLCIENAEWLPVVPLYMDHESGWFMEESEPRAVVGYENNIRVDTTDGHKIKCSRNIFKEYQEIIDLTKLAIAENRPLYLQHSIEYSADEIAMEKPGMFEGKEYHSYRTKMFIHGNALMELQTPACSLEQGCGNFSQESVTIMKSEVKTMPEEVKQDNLTLESKVEESKPLEVAPVIESKPPEPPVAPIPIVNDAEVQLGKVKDELAIYVKKCSDMEEQIQALTIEKDQYKPCWEKSQRLLKEKRDKLGTDLVATKLFTQDQVNVMDMAILESAHILAMKNTKDAKADAVYDSMAVAEPVKQPTMAELNAKYDNDPKFWKK